ncbi:hypothetical protein LNQ52_24715 [Klebsiella pneumoniae subsp. pneumoniae]|nr:hypothetical protein [Klebsiella pneumoniae subsp. pneumoniae]
MTVFGVAMGAGAASGDCGGDQGCGLRWSVSHGWRWIHYQHMDIAEEREHLQKRCRYSTDLFGKPPTGWYTGRDSPNTRQLGGGARRL